MRDDEVFDQLVRTARALGNLVDELVFVGGATTALFFTDPAASDVRPTDDVDAIVEISGTAAYYTLSKRLRSRGFGEDRGDEAVVCRWHHREGMVLDVMPTDARILGFTNVWYSDAIAASMRRTLTPELSIRVVTPPTSVPRSWRRSGNGAPVTMLPATILKTSLPSSMVVRNSPTRFAQQSRVFEGIWQKR